MTTTAHNQESRITDVTPEDSAVNTCENGKCDETSCSRGGVGLALFFLLTIALVGAGFFYLQHKQKTQQAAGVDSAQFTTLQQTITTLQQQVAQLQERVQNAPEDAATVDTSDIEERLSNLEMQAFNEKKDIISPRLTTLDADMQRLQAKVQELAARPQPKLDPITPALGAWLNLRSRLTRNLPYASDLAIVQDVSSSDAELSAIADNMASVLADGVISPQQLQEDLHILREDVLAASQTTPDSFGARLKQVFGRMVTVRKQYIPEGQAANATEALWQMEDMLAKGQVAEAVSIVATLPQAAQNVLGEWLYSAQRAMDTELIFAEAFAQLQKMNEASNEPHPAGAYAPADFPSGRGMVMPHEGAESEPQPGGQVSPSVTDGEE